MDRVTVQWNREAGHKIISRSTAPTVCPNWTISGKYNLLLGLTADSDDWLEPGEQFELLLCPQGGTPHMGHSLSYSARMAWLCLFHQPYRSLKHPASHESGRILPHPPTNPPKIPPADCAYISGAPNRTATHSASFTWEY